MPLDDGLTAKFHGEKCGDHAQTSHSEAEAEGEQPAAAEEERQHRSGDHQRAGEKWKEREGGFLRHDGGDTLAQLRFGVGVERVCLPCGAGIPGGAAGVLCGAAFFCQGGQLREQGCGLPLQQRQGGIIGQSAGRIDQGIGAALGFLRRMHRVTVGVDPSLALLRLLLRGLPLERGGAALQRIRFLLRLPSLLLQGVHLPQGLLQLVDLPLQHGDLAGGAVAPAAVQLLFQSLVGRGIGGILLAGGDEGGDAAFQLGVMPHRQRVLPDKGTALKDLPGYAQKLLTGVQRGESLHGGGGAGIGAGKPAHRRGGAARIPQQRVGVSVRRQLHAALHGGAAPWGIALLVGQRAAFAGGKAVEHGADKGAPCGLAGFVGGADQIQAGMQVQLLLLQPTEGGV